MTVLDTSTIVSAFERRETPSRRFLRELLQDAAEGRAPPPAVSALTVAEVLRGAAGDAALTERYDRFFGACAVHEVIERHARRAAALAAAADTRPLPTRQRPGIVDALIGALAVELGAVVAARDAHFLALPGVGVHLLAEADA